MLSKLDDNSFFDTTPIIKETIEIKPINTRAEISKIAEVSEGTLQKVKKIEAVATPEIKAKLQ